MTEQELAGLISDYSSQGGAFFALWITIVSGYLIVAYLAGSSLKRSQVFILNTFYVWVSSLVMVGFYGSFNTQAHYTRELKLMEPDSPQMMTYDLAVSVTIASVLGIFATLRFMWDIRHPKPD